ncbi:MAG: hypothetical protein ACJ74S_14805 [Gaiellaceae bacterium]
MACAGVHDEAGGLVHHEEMLVLVGDADRDVLRLWSARLGGLLELDHLAGANAPRLRAPLPVHEHAGLDRTLCRRARAHVSGEEPVEAKPRRLRRNL